jgi:anti-anti-sigma regulatory factor
MAMPNSGAVHAMTEAGSVLVVTMLPDLDEDGLESLRDAALERLAGRKLKAIVLDFSGVDVLGTSDFSRIRAFLGTARLLGQQTAVSSLAPGIAAFLAMTDAPTAGIDFFLCLEDALRRYGEARA